MKGRFVSPTGAGRHYLSLGLIAAIFTVLGILIASNLDFTKKSIATISQEAYPVVSSGNGEYSSPFVPVVEKVSDAVVNIAAEQTLEVPYRDDIFYHLFPQPEQAVSFGSGFFFRADGYILTNSHVVGDSKKVTVRTSSGYQYDAQVIGTDPQTDLAVIKVKPEGTIDFVPFGNSDEIRVGDWAIAIGNPFPQQGLDRTVTVGVISAKGRSNLQFGENTPRYQNYIQTDASINPGNSGGPLLNLRGEAIGVNAAISSPSGGSVGIGFAVPINLARAVVPDLIASGKVSRGWLGIYLGDLNQNMAKQLGLSAVKGVFVDSVFKGAPADMAGLKKGDVLLSFNGQDISDAGQLSVMIATAPRDKEAQITLLRKGDKMNVNATIVDREQYQLAHSSQFNTAPQQVRWMGMELMAFNDNIAREINLEFFPGIYVVRVARGSQADRAGIQPGSIITQVDNKEVKNIVELEAIAGGMKSRNTAIPFLLVEPGGSIEYKAVRP
ncbi:MAG: Do family serine endopeptidase [candidate division Zixibacteria bacterium]|nr:Do family serine endopeptidase [candidate division Zixibacteria bacterium]